MAFTYFFRDINIFEAVVKFTLPFLCTKKYIKIWDAGCAMGQEPYTLAMLLCENMGYMYFRNVKILATDIDESNLFNNIISKGEYPKDQLQRIPKEYFEKYFIPVENKEKYVIDENIRKSLEFRKHDLLSLKTPDSDFGLIVCKNVLLHFNHNQRVEVIKMYYDALTDGGYLAFEQTQKMPEELNHLFQQVASNAQVFRKI